MFKIWKLQCPAVWNGMLNNIIAGCSKQLCFADPQWPTCAGPSLRGLSPHSGQQWAALHKQWTHDIITIITTQVLTTLYDVYNCSGRYLLTVFDVMMTRRLDLTLTYLDSQTKPTLKCSSRGFIWRATFHCTIDNVSARSTCHQNITGCCGCIWYLQW